MNELLGKGRRGFGLALPVNKAWRVVILKLEAVRVHVTKPMGSLAARTTWFGLLLIAALP